MKKSTIGILFTAAVMATVVTACGSSKSDMQEVPNTEMSVDSEAPTDVPPSEEMDNGESAPQKPDGEMPNKEKPEGQPPEGQIPTDEESSETEESE